MVWDELLGQTTTARSVFSHYEYYDCGGGFEDQPIQHDGDINPSVENENIVPIQERCRRAVYRTEYTTSVGSYQPLTGAKVRARRWFTTHVGHTDQQGNFSVDGEFRRDANYSIKWERHHYDIRSGNLGQAYYNGPKKRGDWNLNINGGKSRMYAIVHQAAHDYYYGARAGLKSPPRNSSTSPKVKFAVWNTNNEDALGSHCKDCRIMGIWSRLKIWSNGRTFQQLYATTIHELAHASHWELRKNNWNDNNTDEIVKESWARGVELVLTNLRYNGRYQGGATRPTYTQVVVDLIDPNFPTAGDNENLGLWNDNVTGYSLRQIEEVLSNTSSFNEWENNIRNRYENSTENNLGELFNFWN